MDELTRVLWEYASSCRLDAFYDREAQQGREECVHAIECNRKILEQACPPELYESATIICECGEELRWRDMEAAFECGLRLGLSLR